MSDLRTAALRALEAMDELHRTGDTQVFDLCHRETTENLRAALAQPVQPQKPVQDRALQWGAAPVRIELGDNPNGWREAFLALGKDNTLRLLAETEALPLVESALRTALASAAPIIEPEIKDDKPLKETT